uniref:Uncharacterized protein n=1 Tax=viral metagenome TaxID=1070528 RepID=A0A6M3JP52_9ZZZZ
MNKYCPKCSVPYFASQANFCTTDGTKLEGLKKCPKCGNEILPPLVDPNGKFCGNCNYNIVGLYEKKTTI